jgi:hypothetical protein
MDGRSGCAPVASATFLLATAGAGPSVPEVVLASKPLTSQPKLTGHLAKFVSGSRLDAFAGSIQVEGRPSRYPQPRTPGLWDSQWEELDGALLCEDCGGLAADGFRITLGWM